VELVAGLLKGLPNAEEEETDTRNETIALKDFACIALRESCFCSLSGYSSWRCTQRMTSPIFLNDESLIPAFAYAGTWGGWHWNFFFLHFVLIGSEMCILRCLRGQLCLFCRIESNGIQHLVSDSFDTKFSKRSCSPCSLFLRGFRPCSQVSRCARLTAAKGT